jgi:hypothetical protein
VVCDFGDWGHYWPIVPAPDDRWWWLWRNWWNEDWQGRPKYSAKTCPSAALSTTNPAWLGRRGGKPATNRFSYGAVTNVALEFWLSFIFLGSQGLKAPFISTLPRFGRFEIETQKHFHSAYNAASAHTHLASASSRWPLTFEGFLTASHFLH